MPALSPSAWPPSFSASASRSWRRCSSPGGRRRSPALKRPQAAPACARRRSAMETKKSKITVRNVSRTFFSPQGEKIDALKDVSLDVEDAFSPAGRDIGEFRVLLGPSGCGKSTLLRMIAGLDKPDSGEILVNSQPVHSPSKDACMVFQKYTSLPWLTVAENVAYGMKINGVPEAQRK